jgi:tetratricopeptide (TPR) repeat protein
VLPLALERVKSVGQRQKVDRVLASKKKGQQKKQKKLLKKEQKSFARQERQSEKEEQALRSQQAKELASELEQSKSPRFAFMAPWIVAMGAYLCFFGSINAPFLFDDAPVITHNTLIHKWGLADFAQLAIRNPGRALTNLTFYLNFHLAGTRVTAPYGSTTTYHAVSLLFHTLNSLLVFLFIRGLLISRYYRSKEGAERFAPESQKPAVIAFFSALLFAVHPAQAMAVAYIAQRYALVAASLVLGAMVSYLHYRKLSDEGNSRAFYFLTLALVLSWLCFISKENAAIVGFLVIALELCFLGGKKIGQACFFAVPFFYGVAIKGTLGRAAFEISDSAALGYTLVMSLSALLIGLATFGWRLLPDDFPGKLCPQQGADLSLPDQRGGLSRGGLFSLFFAAGLFAMMGCFLTYKAGAFRSSLNMAFILTWILLICRLGFRKSPGLLPGRALLAFGVCWLVLLISKNNGTETISTLDLMFPASETFAPEHAHKQYFYTQLRALLYYPRLMLWPWGYSAEHAYQLSPVIVTGESRGQVFMRAQEFFAMLAHLGFLVLAWRCFRKARLLSFAILWFYISLLISSSIVPILDPLVEQRMYLPLVLMMTALVVITARILTDISQAGASESGFDYMKVLKSFKERLTSVKDQKKKPGILNIRLLAIVIAPLVALYAVRSQDRVKVWSSPETIWIDATEKRPDCARAYSSLGMVRLFRANQLKRGKQPEKADPVWIAAIEAIGAAVEFGEFHVEGWNNLGKAYLELDNDRPTHERAHNKGLSHRGPRYDPLKEAESCFITGIQRGEKLAWILKKQQGPAIPLCWNNLGLVYRRRALRHLEPISQSPSPAKAALYFDKAVQAVDNAIALNPQYIAGLSNIGALKLQRASFEPDPNKRRELANGALQVFARAIQSGRHNPMIFFQVIDAYILIGNFKEARGLLMKLSEGEEKRQKNMLANYCFDHGMKAYGRLERLERSFSETILVNNEVQTIINVLKMAIRNGSSEEALLWRTIGKIYYMNKQSDEALKAYKKSVAADPENPEVPSLKAAITNIEKALKDG